MRPSLFFLAPAFAWAGCVGDSASAPCTIEGACLPGFQCVESVCQPCAETECPTARITLVSSGGGLACGADDVCVSFPRGALTDTAEIEIARTDTPVVFIGASTLSKVYAVRPAGLLPLLPVEIVLPVSRRIEESAEELLILHSISPRGPWESLPTARAFTRASAISPSLGFFVLAREDGPPRPADGGVVVRPDAGPVMPTNPIPGAGTPAPIPGPFTTLHGVAWDAMGNRLLLADRMTGTVLAFPQTGAMPGMPTVFRMMNAAGVYGIATDGARVVMLEHGTRSVTQQMGGGMPMALVDRFEGAAFSSPSDAAIRSDGTIYFTDPATGLGARTREVMFNGVYRRTPSGTLTAEWRGPVASEPRGIELSPDERTLYVADTAGRVVLAWNVAMDGALSGQRTFASTAASPDGVAVDRAGNVYVGTAAGIEVFAPDGTRWGAIPVPGAIGGIAFGGPGLAYLYAATPMTLYITSVTVAGAR